MGRESSQGTREWSERGVRAGGQLMFSAMVAAVSSAALFGAGSSLQHRSAGSSPRSSKRRMVKSLLKSPGWLLGAVLCAIAFALHAVALSRGDISLVQPIILSGIVFAVFARSAIDRRLPSLGEMGWVAVTWLGLIMFIVPLRPGPTREPDAGRALIPIVVGLGAAILVLLLGRANRSRRVLHGALLAAAAGILYGLVAGLLKLTTTEARHGIAVAVAGWPLWTLIVVGGVAVLVNQRSYQSTRLSVTAPVLNVAQLGVALSFGVIVFDERLFSTPASIAVEVIGLSIMIGGVTKLAVRAGGPPGGASGQPASAGQSGEPGDVEGVGSLTAEGGDEHRPV